MRKHMLGTIAALLAVVLMAGAQTPGSEATRATLEKVTVVRGDGGVSVEMTTKGVIAPKVETLSSPDRLVVNLPNTLLATSAGNISVGNAGVRGLRMGMDASGTTRVVLDMERPSKYELVPGQKLILKIADDVRTAHAAAAPMKVTAPVARVNAAPAPASRPWG